MIMINEEHEAIWKFLRYLSEDTLKGEESLYQKIENLELKIKQLESKIINQ